MEYGDEGWSGVDGERRPLRDQYRDVFFGHFGGNRLRNPFMDIVGSGQHIQAVMELIDKARIFHAGEEAAALHLMQQTFTSLGFGNAEERSKERNLSFKHTHLSSLFDYFVG